MAYLVFLFTFHNLILKIILAANVNESCFFHEQCEARVIQTECRDGRCICLFEKIPVMHADGVIICVGKERNSQELRIALMKILSCRHDFDMVWWKLKETESMELIKLLSPASYFSHAKNIFLTWKHGKTKIRSTSVRHDIVDYYISY